MNLKEIEKEWYQEFWKFIESFPDDKWDWDYLSKNPNITFETVQNNPDKPWNWMWLSENPNITFEIVQNNQEKSWDFCWLSDNKFKYQKELFIQQKFLNYHKLKFKNEIFPELLEILLQPDNYEYIKDNKLI